MHAHEHSARGPRKNIAVAFAALALGASLPTTVAVGAGDVASVTIAGHLLRPWDRGAVAMDRGTLLVFGGDAPEVVRFEPATATIVPTRAPLPGAWTDFAFATAPTGAVYLFGGRLADGSATADILRYDPLAEEFRLMNASLPAPTRFAAAATVGPFIYVLGGWSGQSLTTILRYDTVKDRIEPMQAALPSARYEMGVATDGAYVHLFGGLGEAGPIDEILRYDPILDRVTVSNATLPTPRYGVSAVWSDGGALLFGGNSFGNPQGWADILRYDPTARTLQPSGMGLPGPRWHARAACAGDHAYVVGGDSGPSRLTDIVQADLREIAPVHANPGLGGLLRCRAAHV